MQTEMWHRAKAIFQQAIDLPQEQREEFVNQNCKSVELREEVIRMVDLHVEESDFLNSPLSSSSAGNHQDVASDYSDEIIGKTLDDFQVVSRIGAGGMGTVYSARQENPERLVAIKILNVFSLRSEKHRRRFERESKILARLKHPGIAQVYSAGTCDLGSGPKPWFAMELIDGKPLRQFAKNHNLPLHKKIELLLMICDAVQHAHDRGVVHRDLKPANILVEEVSKEKDNGSIPDFRTKIVDFGVARVIDADHQVSMQTAASEIIGTLNYMSPEQVALDSSQIDERCDIYALGVIGFELLSGKLPFDRSTSTVVETIRNIEFEKPDRLSQFDSSLRGDLEVVFGKALESDPSQRYVSVDQFANDLRRFLNREPVIARPPSRIYRTRKFVSRHRTLVAGTTATMLALVVGMVLYAMEARRARIAANESKYEAEKATAINNFVTNDFMMKFIAASRSDNRDDPIAADQLVDQAASNIKRMFGDRPAIEAAVRNEVGTIYHNLSAIDKAASQFEEALELWSGELGDEHTDTLKAVNNLGLCRMIQGRRVDAEKLFRRALSGRLKLLGEDDLHTIATMNNLAEVLKSDGRTNEAEELLVRAVGDYRSADEHTNKNRLVAMVNLGSLWVRRDKIDQANELHSKVYEISRKQLGDDHLMALYAGSRAAQTLLKAEEYDTAIEILVPISEKFRMIRGPAHPDTILTKRVLARIYVAKGDSETAKDHLCAAEAALVDAGEHPNLLKRVRFELDRLGQ